MCVYFMLCTYLNALRLMPPTLNNPVLLNVQLSLPCLMFGEFPFVCCSCVSSHTISEQILVCRISGFRRLAATLVRVCDFRRVRTPACFVRRKPSWCFRILFEIPTPWRSETNVSRLWSFRALALHLIKILISRFRFRKGQDCCALWQERPY